MSGYGAFLLPPHGDFIVTFGNDQPMPDYMRAQLAEQIKYAMQSQKPIMVAPELQMEVTPILPRNLASLTFPA